MGALGCLVSASVTTIMGLTRTPLPIWYFQRQLSALTAAFDHAGLPPLLDEDGRKYPAKPHRRRTTRHSLAKSLHRSCNANHDGEAPLLQRRASVHHSELEKHDGGSHLAGPRPRFQAILALSQG